VGRSRPPRRHVCRPLFDRTRKLVLPQDISPSVLRFHPACPFGQGVRHPCPLARYRDIVTDASRAIMRTALTPDARKFDRTALGRRHQARWIAKECPPAVHVGDIQRNIRLQGLCEAKRHPCRVRRAGRSRMAGKTRGHRVSAARDEGLPRLAAPHDGTRMMIGTRFSPPCTLTVTPALCCRIYYQVGNKTNSLDHNSVAYDFQFSTCF
jgi:hypothetical protein